MKIIVGVDESDRYVSLLRFVSAFGLPDVQIRFVHVISPLTGYDGAYTAVAAIDGAGIYSVEREAAGDRLDDACRLARSMNMEAGSEIAFGYPTPILNARAHHHRADLIALASSPQGCFMRLVSGSVALSLAENTPYNLLIVRSEKTEWDALKVVYATDHSEVAQAGIEELLEWRPKGIAQLEVLTAFELVGRETAIAGGHRVMAPAEVDHLVASTLKQRTELVADQFRTAGIPAAAKCLECSAVQAIHQTLTEMGSDLLVLACREHSFWKNVFGVSATNYEIKTEPCSLLLLRSQIAAES